MRIVDVNPFFHPFRGGIEMRMKDTNRILAERGHDVTVVTGRLPGTAEEEFMDGYRVIRLESRFVNIYNPPYISSKNVLETLNDLDADVVNYNYRWAPSYNKDLGAYEGKKVFTDHNTWGEGAGIQSMLSRINDEMFRKHMEAFDHIICVSEHLRRDLIQRGFPDAKISTIPNCLNELPEMRGEEDFILSLGRIVRVKGLDYLVEAMRGIDSKLIICGRGPDLNRISKLVSRKGLEDKVEIRGWVSEEEKAGLMGSCKVFVMPSLFEAMGIAALEAISYGRPVVCTDVNGLPETVGEAARIIRPKDPKAISDAVNALLDDPAERERMGNLARARAGRFLWKDHIGKIEEIYEKVAR